MFIVIVITTKSHTQWNEKDIHTLNEKEIWPFFQSFEFIDVC